MADSKLPRTLEPRNKLTAERAREVLDYDPETGEFAWKVRNCGRRDRVGTVTKGRRRIAIDGTVYIATRLAWLIMTGEWPKGEVDHKDRNPLNDRWENLRDSTKTQNQYNAPAHSHNTSGFKGVHWHIRRKAWIARIRDGGKSRHLGVFATPEAAHEAYCKAARELHGEFVRTE